MTSAVVRIDHLSHLLLLRALSLPNLALVSPNFRVKCQERAVLVSPDRVAMITFGQVTTCMLQNWHRLPWMKILDLYLKISQ